MARIPYIDPEHPPAAAAADFADLPRLNILKLMAHAETAFGPWLRFSGALLNDLSLDPNLRQLAILRVAALSPGAEYEWDQHEAISRQIGLSEERIEAARSGGGSSDDDRLILTFTEEVVLNVSPSNPTWKQMAARFSPREIVELLMVIGQYMMVARVMATTQIDPDPPIGTEIFTALR